MYLLTIAVAEENGNDGPLPLGVLEASLEVSAASTNEMVRKLEHRSLLTYQPYRGVELTVEGRRVAYRVLRTRRLWSRFLADHLDFTPNGADALACHLEHVTPPDAADRLAAYLGDPDTGPLGRPIPKSELVATFTTGEPLAGVPAGIHVEVVAVVADDITTAFLAREGVVPGARLEPLAVGPSSVLVDAGDGPADLAASVAASVLVQPTGQDPHDG